jgi:hypothetical protein
MCIKLLFISTLIYWNIEKSIKIILIKKNVLFLVGLYDEHAFGLCSCLNA